MRKAIDYVRDRLLGKHLEFRVRLFNMLAIAGILVSLIAAISASINDEDILASITCLATSVISVFLLVYATKSGRYQLCYMITIVFIFFGFFPSIFIIGGGYESSMPLYFVFAVMFTVFMLEGLKALITALLEIVAYCALIVLAYLHPAMITQLPNRQAVVIDLVVGLVVVCLSLGLTLFYHFRSYNQQQRALEAAKEEALKYSEAKSNFLASMSHEIRTPIGIMLGMNEVILRETDSDQIRAYGHSIENAGQQLLTLINNILDVSTIEKGMLEITEERYETAELISALSAAGESLARGRDLRFATEADETLPRCLKGDLPHIRQIVTNFLSNAAKYTDQGGITLSFSALPLNSADGVTLQIAVVDTGIGIKAEIMPRLFDTFTRGDTQGRYVEGSGLGLAIAKEYAERMGGRVFAESELGHGSVFALELKQKVADWEPMGYWERAKRSPSALRTNSFTAPECDVLIVDDNNENLRLLKSLLSRTLMRVETADSGATCLAMASKRRYDVILMDYMMPGMNGEETLRRLKALPGFDTPVIALTANVVAGVREQLLDAGFCQYLSKPIMWRDLENTLLDVLPKERVTTVTVNPTEQVSAAAKDAFSRELAACGVELDDGLRYVGGDITLYGRLAAIFTENYDAAADAVHALAKDNDWTGMKFRVHSLKGHARNLGVSALSDTAAKLERLCASGDGPYILAALPTLFLEWERAKCGLAAFTEKLRGMLPEREREMKPAPELSDLLDMLKFNQFQNALDALDTLIENGADAERARLCDIRQKTDALQFREAERLLSALMESEANSTGR